MLAGEIRVAQLHRLLQHYPQARWHRFDPVQRDNVQTRPYSKLFTLHGVVMVVLPGAIHSRHPGQLSAAGDHDPAGHGSDQGDHRLLRPQAGVGYRFMAWSILAIAVIGFLVWGHHMFVSGQSAYAGLVFSLLNIPMAVPSAITPGCTGTS